VAIMKQTRIKSASSILIKNASTTAPAFAKALTSLILICLPILLPGCDREDQEVKDQEVKNQEVKGEMFISTAGGGSVCLSGVQVIFFQRQQLAQSIAESTQAASAARPDFEAVIEDCDSKIRDLRKRQQDIFDNPLSYPKVAFELARAQRDIISQLRNNTIKLRDNWPPASYYFSNFPKAEFETRTAADGKFSIELPPGDWIMVAHSKRDLGTSEEQYYWVYPVNSPAGNALANYNTVTSDDPNSLLKTKM
jgi:hypothetical protein